MLAQPSRPFGTNILRYAIDKGASVLNNSWGGTEYSSALNEAIAYSYNHGATFVAAAGNSGSNNDSAPMYPASYDVPNILSVAAIDNYNDLAAFSNYGQSSVLPGGLVTVLPEDAEIMIVPAVSGG